MKQQLDLASDKITKKQEIDSAEASKILSSYVTTIIEKELTNIKDSGGDLQEQVDLVNRIIIWMFALFINLIIFQDFAC